jgi:hypothetical protein
LWKTGAGEEKTMNHSKESYDWLIEEIIRDLCGSELHKGYGFDERSDVIKKLKILKRRINEDAPTVPQQPQAGSDASPKPPCSCNLCPAHLCVCEKPYTGFECTVFWKNMAASAVRRSVVSNLNHANTKA